MTQVEQQQAAIRLQLFTVRETDEDGNPKKSYDQFFDCWRKYQQGVQKGMGDCLIHLRNIRAEGKSRFPTPDERRNPELPDDCYQKEDIQEFERILYKALRESGIISYIFGQSSHSLAGSQFSGDKLLKLLRGSVAYPYFKSPGMYVHNVYWKVHFEERVVKNKEGKERTFEAPVITIKGLFSGKGPVVLELYGVHGKGADSKIAVLKKLEKLGWKPDKRNKTLKEGWKKSAISIHRVERPGEGIKWFVQIPYKSPRETTNKRKKSFAVVHRGVANALYMTVVDRQKIYQYSYSGHRIVMHKRQYYARRKRILNDIAGMRGDGRGRSYKYRPLRKLGNKEQRFTDTELWRMARWVQNIVEESNSTIVVMESFGSISTDLRGDDGKKLAPYVRKWPYGSLKLKIKDALNRRSKTKVDIKEVDADYISQTCPLCGHKSSENVRTLPSVSRPEDHRDGLFHCQECGNLASIDSVASFNMALGTEDTPVWVESSIRSSLKRLLNLKKKLSKARIDTLNELAV